MSSPYISAINLAISGLSFQLIIIVCNPAHRLRYSTRWKKTVIVFLLNLPFTMVTYVDTDQQLDDLFLIAATQHCEGIIQHKQVYPDNYISIVITLYLNKLLS